MPIEKKYKPDTVINILKGKAGELWEICFTVLLVLFKCCTILVSSLLDHSLSNLLLLVVKDVA